MLRVKQVYTEGFEIEQIWAQARRVLDAGREEIERSIEGLEREEGGVEKMGILGDGGAGQDKPVKAVRFDEEGFEIGSDSEAEEDEEMESVVGDDAGESIPGDDMEMLTEEDVDDAEAMDDQGSDFDPEEDVMGARPQDEFVPDKHGLNDGFFSIDDFNRQSEFLEQQDARGDPDDGAASDEEDIDWEANPASLAVPTNGASDLVNGNEREESDEEHGPTFGDADLDAEDISDEGSIGSAMNDIDGFNNTNDIMYADFFAPPARKASKKDTRLPKTQPPPSTSLAQEPDHENDIQRTISAVRRDIFEDDLSQQEASEESDPAPPSDPDAPLSRRSNHQKRQAKLAAEIRKLEAANVAKRDWTLSGEARAADRPLNSLLEQDLEFERAGKPIPVITSEVSEDIEALIKRRILSRDFDEVIRRRPGDLITGKEIRRGRFELDDSKAQQSLAEIYEAEHLQTVDPEGYMSKRDEKLKKEHEKIETLWADVSAKLDALSSWHYKPKPPQASINVVADVPTISMEDARPSAGADVGGQSMLAPQEVYRAGEGADKKREVMLKSGVAKAREEMTREEKLRRRRREKERIRKAGGLVEGKGKIAESKKAKEKKEVVGQLKRGGVKVIGKKGELRDVEGKAAEGRKGLATGGGGFKL